MEFKSNLTPFYVYAVIIFIFISCMLILYKNVYISLIYSGLIFLWFLSKIEAHDYKFDENKISIDNRLKLFRHVKIYRYDDIDNIFILNLKHSRHPYQRLEISLKDGTKKKFASTKISDDDFMTMYNLLKEKGVKAKFETD